MKTKQNTYSKMWVKRMEKALSELMSKNHEVTDLVHALKEAEVASTTVWTNHGEPQPLDDEHFGVALQTEVETDATRQAKPMFQEDYSNKPRHALELRYLEEIDKLQLELIQARLELGQFRKERDELLVALKCCLIEKPRNWNVYI